VFSAVIPRFIWRDKPDSSVGQLFNRQFKISDDPNTYISATFLGELYWNFGWPGILIGMAFIGFALGRVNRACSLAQTKSLTQYLVLSITMYLICLRLEGGIALQFIQWFRSLLMIGALHMLFARAGAGTMINAKPANKNPVSEKSAGNLQPVEEKLPYPNLLR
jgi:hypothetical protein